MLRDSRGCAVRDAATKAAARAGASGASVTVQGGVAVVRGATPQQQAAIRQSCQQQGVNTTFQR